MFKFMKNQFALVVCDSILLNQGSVFLCSSLLTWSVRTTFLKTSLASKDWGIKGIQCLRFFCFHCYQVPCFIQVCINIFLSLPFVNDVLAGALLVTLDILGQIQLHLGFSFPIFTPGFLDTVSVFTFEFGQVLLVHPCRHPRISAWLSLCWNASLISSSPGGGSPLMF